MSDAVASLVLVVGVALPLLLAVLLLFERSRPIGMALAPWSPLPALLVSLGFAGKPGLLLVPLLLGTELDARTEVTHAFLLLTAVVWFAAGVFARTYLAHDRQCIRFWTFFLASAAGNIGLVVAADVASFYLFFSLMTVSAYGLVVHVGSDEAHRAGRVYLGMSLLGELLVLAAFVHLVGHDLNMAVADVPRAVAASAQRDLVAAVILVGFGIKAGLLVVHVWLPLAHPVAPTPASAVLSGAMIKAGLLGWLRFLPLGVVATPALGSLCLVLGLSASFAGVLLGLGQRDPKTILAYSSVSQMGFMTAAIGIALAEPAAAPAAIGAILFYAVHHAFAKAALFLGVGVASAASLEPSATRGQGRWARRLVTLGLVLPALDLAGAPLSTGALAKISLKHVVALAPWGHELLVHLLSVGAVGSSLLMLHFLTATAPGASGRVRAGLWVPWMVLLLADVILLFAPPVTADEAGILVDLDKLWDAGWPVLVALALAMAATFIGRFWTVRLVIPAGDLLWLGEQIVGWLRRLGAAVPRRGRARRAWLLVEGALAAQLERVLVEAVRAEQILVAFGTIGLLFVVLLVLLLAALPIP